MEIADAAGINEQTAQRCINLWDGGIYESYHLALERQLAGQVEADETYQSSGSKGLARQRQSQGRGISVHCNTIQGILSGLHNFLARFRGMSQRFLHLRVARYEFLHNHSHLTWQQTFDAAVRSIFSIPGDYWRRMVHQHRRIPLTLCYR